MQYYTRTNEGLKKITGEKLESKQFPDFKFYSYVDENEVHWICELTSGFAVGSGLSFNDAKRISLNKITHVGTTEFKRLIEEQIKTYGRANKAED